MFKTLRNAWKIPDLRKKILFTLMILLVYRFGAVLPIPFIDAQQLGELVNGSSAMGGTLFGYMNILSGQALEQGSLFALGVSPYITSSIVLQLVGIAFPKLGAKFKDEKEVLNLWTRATTIILAILTAIGFYFYLRNSHMLLKDGQGWLGGIVIVACFCAGASIVMWLGELINAHGIGNGISMILFANILAGSQALVSACYTLFSQGWGWKVYTACVLLFSIAAIFFVVYVTNSERRLPVEYAKKVVGRKMYGGQKTTLPIKLNMSGVMPIIFANAIVSLPQTLQMIFSSRIKDSSFWKSFFWWLSYESPLYAIAFFVLIIAFAYFYISISFDAVEVSNNLQKNGGFIKGYRPGAPTATYIKRVLDRITLMGALFLAVIAIVPLVANMVVVAITDNAYGGHLTRLAFGGSSLLIVVGVILETGREIEAQMTMRHYKGFLE